jgi:hypothetical protein
MICVFEQILIEKQHLDPDVLCLHIYDKCSSVFYRSLCDYLYMNVEAKY